MENETKNKNRSILKSVAIVGFIGIVIIISWLSVQLVNSMPNTFSSLASLAEVLNQKSFEETNDNQPQLLAVTNDTNIINTGETINLSWGTSRIQGTYIFSYLCTNGVSVDILDVNNGIKNIACDTNYNIGNVDSINIQVESEKKRFENIIYSISFLATNDTNPRATGESSFTVINSSIKDVASPDTEEVETPVVEEEVDTAETESTEPETTETEPVTSTPTYEQEFVYTIPTSDPNGKTDLSTKFLSTGNIVGSSYFAGIIEQNDSGAIQFEVKNYGNKTSEKWGYSMSLPGGGTYTAENQEPLKPNERAVITIGFPTTDISRYAFIVRVEESTDRNTLNNQFTQVVNFVE